MSQNHRQMKAEQNNDSIASSECTISTIATDNWTGQDFRILKLKIDNLKSKVKSIESQQKCAKLENAMQLEKSESQRQKMGGDMANLIADHQRQKEELEEVKGKNERLEGILEDVKREKKELTQKLGQLEANMARILAFLKDQKKNNLDTQLDLNLNQQEQMEEEEKDEDEDGGAGGEDELGEEDGEEEEFGNEVEGHEEDEEEEEGEEDEERGGNDYEDDDEPIGQEQEKEADESMEIIEEIPLQNAEQPRPTIRRKRSHQTREYQFLKTVRSLIMLDKIRFKHSCNFINNNKKRLENLKPIIMPCIAKYKKGCAFELLALPSDLVDGTIHVYSLSQHNHPLKPEEQRALHRVKKELISHDNPPRYYRTADNIEWTFLQTFPDHDQMKKFKRENQCGQHDHSTVRQVRYYCTRRSHKCKFMLLILKTTQQGYHVYKHGEHNNHSEYKQKKSQQKGRKSANDQQKQLGMKAVRTNLRIDMKWK